MLATGMTVTAAPAPKPAAVAPAARPRLSGNHFSELPEQVPYTAPAPAPVRIWAKYRNPKLEALEQRIQPMVLKMAPKIMTGRGPNLSTPHPSRGTSQVSKNRKMVNDS